MMQEVQKELHGVRKGLLVMFHSRLARTMRTLTQEGSQTPKTKTTISSRSSVHWSLWSNASYNTGVGSNIP
eukprot:7116739-Heterocapsa_arctica.AAC.1